MQTTSNGLIRPRRGDVWGLLRGGVVAVAAAATAVGATWLLVLSWVALRAQVLAPGPAQVDTALGLCAATVAIGAAAWLTVGVLLEVLGQLPGPLGARAARCADRVTPALARRIAGFLLGVGLGVVGAPSATAAGLVDSPVAGAVIDQAPDPGFVPGPPLADFTPSGPGQPAIPPQLSESPTPPKTPGPSAPFEPSPRPATPSRGFTPSPPVVRPQPDPELLGGRARFVPEGAATVVVHRGDTLWRLAARHLGAQATDAEIADAWPRWYELNKQVIGSDPDLLMPGVILQVPGTDIAAAGVSQ